MFEKLIYIEEKKYCSYFSGPILSSYEIYSPSIYSNDYTAIFMGTNVKNNSLWAIKVYNSSEEDNLDRIKYETSYDYFTSHKGQWSC